MGRKCWLAHDLRMNLARSSLEFSCVIGESRGVTFIVPVLPVLARAASAAPAGSYYPKEAGTS